MKENNTDNENSLSLEERNYLALLAESYPNPVSLKNLGHRLLSLGFVKKCK